MKAFETINKTQGPEKGKRSIWFMCPGCREYHRVVTGANGWIFNENFEKPTFSPSILVTYIHQQNPRHPKSTRCHSFVKEGMIQFLPDCTHECRNYTMPLPEINREGTREVTPRG